MAFGVGKLLGRVAGEVISLPATVIKESEEALEQAEKTVTKRMDDVTEPKKDK